MAYGNAEYCDMNCNKFILFSRKNQTRPTREAGRLHTDLSVIKSSSHPKSNTVVYSCCFREEA